MMPRSLVLLNMHPAKRPNRNNTTNSSIFESSGVHTGRRCFHQRHTMPVTLITTPDNDYLSLAGSVMPIVQAFIMSVTSNTMSSVSGTDVF